MTPQAESAAVYEQVRERMTALLREAPPEALGRQVPACPAWTVKDLTAHVVGLAVDVAAGRVEGAGSDPWTAAQVEARTEAALDELLAEWDAVPLQQALLGVDEMQAAQVVFDLTTHEHDLRGALGQPGARDSRGVEVGWQWATTVLGMLRDGYGEGAVVLRTPAGETTCGSADETSGVRADRFELFRAMTGRRSSAQVAAWEWTGEPAVERLCLLPARATALVE